MRQNLISPKAITLILFLQLIPLIMFPLSSFSAKTQEWWLPVLMAVMVLAGVFQIVFRRSLDAWPWYLLSFAQGFNIISRLMMLLPHATYNVGGVWVFDTLYTGLSIASILFSWWLLGYFEMPEVRLGLIRMKAQA